MHIIEGRCLLMFCGSECALIRGRKPQGKNEKKVSLFFLLGKSRRKKRRKMTLLEDTQLKDSGGRSFLLSIGPSIIPYFIQFFVFSLFVLDHYLISSLSCWAFSINAPAYKHGTEANLLSLLVASLLLFIGRN